MEKIYETIDSVESLEKALKRLRKAQNEFSHYTQEQVDKIFAAAAIAEFFKKSRRSIFFV